MSTSARARTRAAQSAKVRLRSRSEPVPLLPAKCYLLRRQIIRRRLEEGKSKKVKGNSEEALKAFLTFAFYLFTFTFFSIFFALTLIRNVFRTGSKQ
jgi:hypothetical protein